MRVSIVAAFTALLFGQTTFKDTQDSYPRVRQAREEKEPYLDSLFHRKDIDYPPFRILIVAYKHEQILELWARSESSDVFTLVKQYPFTAYCGTLGPKRRRGDLQIPEGLYHIIHFNPYSNFHLSMLIDYPNRSDDILSSSSDLGGEIRIHGSNVTIGCIPVGDDAIKELYTMGVDVRSNDQPIPVYIFPCRMHAQNLNMLETITASNSGLWSFWQNLCEGYRLFTQIHRQLKYSIDAQGRYIFNVSRSSYPWHREYDKNNCLMARIAVPLGYERTSVPIGSFKDWLRTIPLKPNTPPVYLYNNEEKLYQGGHHAVIDIDVGNADLQQCADALIRLYAEYLYSYNEFDNIVFLITNGDNISFRKWIDGFRPSVHNNVVTWHQNALPDSSYTALRTYLNFIFAYAGTFSLSRQLHPVKNIQDMMVGDIFIQGGFPGHAVIVMDMAEHEPTGKKIFLLAQSYMPAQDIHILKNLRDPLLNPWYPLDFGDTLCTPEWTFRRNDLVRF